MGVQGALFYGAYWEELKGQPSGVDGLNSFFRSRYFNNLPTPRIHNQLGAELLTGGQPILPGDVMDVQLMGVAIPVSHFVLTDKKVSERIKRLGIDREWDTEVFSMSEIDSLFRRLKALI
jgi:hypothetical protein